MGFNTQWKKFGQGSPLLGDGMRGGGSVQLPVMGCPTSSGMHPANPQVRGVGSSHGQWKDMAQGAWTLNIS